MSRIRIILLVAVGALVGALLVPTAANGAAAILKVVVTNTGDNPVPVRGSVNVSGPAAGGDPVPVSGSVTVADDREPFEIRLDMSTGAGGFTANDLFQVPEDKRLVVEFIAASVTMPDTGDVPLLSANANGGALGFPIPLTKQGVGNGNAFYRGAMELLDFEEPGEFYSVDFSRQAPGGGLVTGTATAFVYLSGYLLPAG